jgi:hypothetical protein
MFPIVNHPNNQNPQPNYLRWLVAIFMVGSMFGAFGAGVFDGIRQTTDSATPKQNPSVFHSGNQALGRAEYERLQIGITQAEVESILGRGIEVEKSVSNATYTWTNADSSSITAIFQNGRLVQKFQHNLL